MTKPLPVIFRLIHKISLCVILLSLLSNQAIASEFFGDDPDEEKPSMTNSCECGKPNLIASFRDSIIAPLKNDQLVTTAGLEKIAMLETENAEDIASICQEAIVWGQYARGICFYYAGDLIAADSIMLRGESKLEELALCGSPSKDLYFGLKTLRAEIDLKLSHFDASLTLYKEIEDSLSTSYDSTFLAIKITNQVNTLYAEGMLVKNRDSVINHVDKFFTLANQIDSLLNEKPNQDLESSKRYCFYYAQEVVFQYLENNNIIDISTDERLKSHMTEINKQSANFAPNKPNDEYAFGTILMACKNSYYEKNYEKACSCFERLKNNYSQWSIYSSPDMFKYYYESYSKLRLPTYTHEYRDDLHHKISFLNKLIPSVDSLLVTSNSIINSREEFYRLKNDSLISKNRALASDNRKAEEKYAKTEFSLFMLLFFLGLLITVAASIIYFSRQKLKNNKKESEKKQREYLELEQKTGTLQQVHNEVVRKNNLLETKRNSLEGKIGTLEELNLKVVKKNELLETKRNSLESKIGTLEELNLKVIKKNELLETKRNLLELVKNNATEIGDLVNETQDLNAFMATSVESLFTLVRQVIPNVDMFHVSLVDVDQRSGQERFVNYAREAGGYRLKKQDEVMPTHGSSISAWVLKNQENAFSPNLDLDYLSFGEKFPKVPIGEKPNSIYIIPLPDHQGVIGIQSREKNAFDEEIHGFILESLAENLSVAIKQMRSQEELRQEKADALELKREISHRLKNHLGALSLNLEKYLESYKVRSSVERTQTVQVIKAKVNAILEIHRTLDRQFEAFGDDTTKQVDQNFLSTKTYLTNLKHLVLEDCLGIPVEFIGGELYFAEDVKLKHEFLKDLGTVLVELILNSYEHAYEVKEQPWIGFSAVYEDQHLSIIISDKGRGTTKDQLMESSSYGIKLLHTMLERWRGTWEFNPPEIENVYGTAIKINFSF